MVRQCADRSAHIQNTNTQYNHPAFAKKISRKYNRDRATGRFENFSVRSSVQADLAMIDAFNKLIKQLEWQIEKLTRQHDYLSLSMLRSFPGVGQVLALVIIYDIKVKEFVDRLTSKHNKGRALGIYTHKLGRAIYYMLKNKKAFDMELFFNA